MDNSDRTDLGLYNKLPESIQRSAGLEGDSIANASSLSGESFVTKYVEDSVVEGYEADKVYSTKVKNKVLMFDNPAKDQTEAKEKQKNRRRANKSKALTAKEKRSLNVYNIPIEARKYELFMPLHELWKGYMDELFRSTNPVAFTQKLLKADFHGALITGSSGIVAQETENVFNIITPSNALLVIPKVNNVFTLYIKGSVFTVHGNQFRYRASQRSTKKFKSKPTIDL
ncbi:RNase P/RNase MRP complex subunit [Haplosporangium sp. Z 27]|nr:RNase P/RNase MRP complex subunit [Haplosporangium sp. Z 27]